MISTARIWVPLTAHRNSSQEVRESDQQAFAVLRLMINSNLVSR
jgi:hypothetical protein